MKPLGAYKVRRVVVIRDERNKLQPLNLNKWHMGVISLNSYVSFSHFHFVSCQFFYFYFFCCYLSKLNNGGFTTFTLIFCGGFFSPVIWNLKWYWSTKREYIHMLDYLVFLILLFLQIQQSNENQEW
jgi:hypothetical protein